MDTVETLSESLVRLYLNGVSHNAKNSSAYIRCLYLSWTTIRNLWLWVYMFWFPGGLHATSVKCQHALKSVRLNHFLSVTILEKMFLTCQYCFAINVIDCFYLQATLLGSSPQSLYTQDLQLMSVLLPPNELLLQVSVLWQNQHSFQLPWQMLVDSV